MSREALTSLIAAANGRRHSLHLRRDLSRARLCLSGGDRGRVVAACARDQFLLEIFLHDRLAGRLDGGAGAAGSPRRAAAAESRDLGADAVADRSRGGLRRSRGDGSDQARLSREPPHPDRGIACGRSRRNSCPPTVRSIFTPMSPTSPPTVSPSPSGCWRRRMSQRHPASTSIPFTAGISSAFPTRARPTTCARRWRGSRAG